MLFVRYLLLPVSVLSDPTQPKISILFQDFRPGLSLYSKQSHTLGALTIVPKGQLCINCKNYTIGRCQSPIVYICGKCSAENIEQLRDANFRRVAKELIYFNLFWPKVDNKQYILEIFNELHRYGTQLTGAQGDKKL